MKQLSTGAVLILTACVMFFIACKKENTMTPNAINSTQSPPTVKPDTSSNTKEFIFNDLTWDFDNDGGGNLYIGIENFYDHVGNSAIAGVYIKSDHDTAWIAAENFHYPNSPGYVYSLYSNILFVFYSPHIFSWSDYNHIGGTKVSIKVKIV